MIEKTTLMKANKGPIKCLQNNALLYIFYVFFCVQTFCFTFMFCQILKLIYSIQIHFKSFKLLDIF